MSERLKNLGNDFIGHSAFVDKMRFLSKEADELYVGMEPDNAGDMAMVIGMLKLILWQAENNHGRLKEVYDAEMKRTKVDEVDFMSRSDVKEVIAKQELQYEC